MAEFKDWKMQFHPDDYYATVRVYEGNHVITNIHLSERYRTELELDVAKAKGSLIAAAPDLLAACESALDSFRLVDELLQGKNSLVRRRIGELEAAIKKARVDNS